MEQTPLILEPCQQKLSQDTSTIPFEKGKYKGRVHATIWRDTATSAVFIRVMGKRLSLESFQGQYSASLKEIFGTHIVSDRRELKDLTSIFGNKKAMKAYGTSQREDEKKILERIEKDASRTFRGDVFTGFGITENASGRIIGRISLGSGYEPGESQSGLIISPDYRGQSYGKEAICLAGALALVFYQNQFQVGDSRHKAPVFRFTATALNSNQKSIKLITDMGLDRMRPLTPKENYSDEPRSLYGVEGVKMAKVLEKIFDKSQFHWEISENQRL